MKFTTLTALLALFAQGTFATPGVCSLPDFYETTNLYGAKIMSGVHAAIKGNVVVVGGLNLAPEYGSRRARAFDTSSSSVEYTNFDVSFTSQVTSVAMAKAPFDINSQHLAVLGRESWNKVSLVSVNQETSSPSTSTKIENFQPTSISSSDPHKFGASVAMTNDTVLIGAPGDNKIYQCKIVQSGNSFTLQEQGTLSESSGEFGLSVAISPSGLLAVVGAPMANGLEGEVHIYERASVSDNFASTSKFTIDEGLTPSVQQCFGLDVDTDGSTIIVGAPDHNGGAVYVYERNEDQASSTKWVKATTLLPSMSTVSGTGGKFGRQVSVSGCYVAVSDPSILVNNYRGAVHLFRKTCSGWDFEQSIEYAQVKGNDATSDFRFGRSLSMDVDSDGVRRLAVGAFDTSSSSGDKRGEVLSIEFRPQNV